MAELAFTVNGMKCGGCVAKAQEAIRAVPGVTGANVDLASKSARVEGTADPQLIINALKAAGYPAELKR